MSTSKLKQHPLIQLVDAHSRLQGRIKTLFANVHQETGLRAMEDLVLNAISEADRPPTVPQIGRSLGHPRQVIQRAVNDLADNDLIERRQNPDHKRAPLLVVTPKGKQLKALSDSKALALADRFLTHYEPSNCEHLAQELIELRKAMEQFFRTEKTQ